MTILCLGERVYVSLYGAAVDANVRLDKSTLRIDNTYICMANQRTLTIHNRSDVLVHFKWSPFATKMEEDMQKERYLFIIVRSTRLLPVRLVRISHPGQLAER